MLNSSASASPRVPDHTAIDQAMRIAIEHHQAGRLKDADAIYRETLRLAPGHPDALHLSGLVAHRNGKLAHAVDLIEEAIRTQPDSPVLYNNLGTVLLDQQRVDDAAASFRQALQRNPDYVEALSNLANALDALGQTDEAIAAYRKALSLRPDFAEANFNLANALKRKLDFDGALAAYRRALTLKPGYAAAHCNLGLMLHELGNPGEALACYHRALEHSPHLAEAHCNMANALHALGRDGDALAAYRQAVASKPDYAEAHFRLANLLQTQGESDEAILCLRQGLALEPNNAEMRIAFARTLQELGKLEEAAEQLRQVIEAEPGFADAHSSLGFVLQRLGKLEEAVLCFRRAIGLRPDFAEAYSNLGLPLQLQGRLDEAVASYRQALAIQPDYVEAHSNLLLTMQYMPFSPAERFAEHLRYGEHIEEPLRPGWQVHRNAPAPSRKLRVGYVSGDFRDHAVAYFIEPILAHHDKHSFEVVCYHNHSGHDAVSEHIAAIADRWIPCHKMSDDALAERIRSDGIDILVDLSGHTAYNRLPAFARKPAPVQMTWIGYPATTGLTAMDCRITEEALDPVGMTERYHTETLLRLPAGAAFRPASDSPPVNALPALASGQFTLACLNSIVKLNANVVRLWSRILTALPHAKLVLGNITEPATRQRLLDWFAGEGIAEDRLLALPRMTLADYLEIHHHIDLALDPFPYSGGTTSCHSLWMGVPVVTLAGCDTASRYGVALMQGLGLPQFIAASEEDYLARVCDFARDLPELDRIRQSLRDRVGANLTRDPMRLTRHLEDAYREAWKKWCDTRSV